LYLKLVKSVQAQTRFTLGQCAEGMPLENESTRKKEGVEVRQEEKEERKQYNCTRRLVQALFRLGQKGKERRGSLRGRGPKKREVWGCGGHYRFA